MQCSKTCQVCETCSKINSNAYRRVSVNSDPIAVLCNAIEQLMQLEITAIKMVNLINSFMMALLPSDSH